MWVQVELDNHLSRAYTKVELACADRKGLLFDLMRTLKDINIRVAYGLPQARTTPGCCVLMECDVPAPALAAYDAARVCSSRVVPVTSACKMASSLSVYSSLKFQTCCGA